MRKITIQIALLSMLLSNGFGSQTFYEREATITSLGSSGGINFYSWVDAASSTTADLLIWDFDRVSQRGSDIVGGYDLTPPAPQYTSGNYISGESYPYDTGSQSLACGFNYYMESPQVMPATLAGTNDATVTLWVKPTSVTSVYYPTVLTLGDAGQSANKTWIIETDNANPGKWGFGIIGVAHYIGTIAATTNWQHLGLVLSNTGKTLTMYVDGVPCKTNTTGSALFESPFLELAKSTIGTYYTGSLDDLRLYASYAATEAEMLSEARGTNIAQTMTAHYDFNAWQTNVAADVGEEGILPLGVVADLPTWNTNGSWSFVGGDYIAITNNPPLFTNDAFTVSFWANPVDTDANQYYVAVGSEDTHVVGENWGITLGGTQTNGNAIAGIAIKTNLDPGGAQVAWSGTTNVWTDAVDAGVWRHVCVTYDSGITKVFKDGVKLTLDYDNFSLLGTNGNFAVGVDSDDLNSWGFNGSVDDVRLFSTAMTEAYVTNTLYDGGRQ